MKELHIPYGINRHNREIIEPEDAKRGRDCNCLCPGCEAPLLSRHPKSDDRRTHFAHDSKHADAKPIEDCPLSPEVAFAMMARHVARGLAGKTIRLGAHEKSMLTPCCFPSSTLIELIPKQEAVIERAEAFASIGGVQYDLGFTLNGKSYFVDIVYAGKPKKDLPGAEHLQGIGGILCVAAGQYLAMMMGDEFNKLRYGESVEHFLLNHSSYDWEYHHLEQVKMAEAQQNHKCSLPLSTQLFGHRQSTSSYTPYGSSYSPINATQTYGQPATQERTVACFYCGQPMTTRALKTPALGHRCQLCAKHNRQAPHPRSPITKESNHRANMAAEQSVTKIESGGYKDIRG